MTTSFSPRIGGWLRMLSGILTALLAAVSCIGYIVKDYFIGELIYVPTALACAGFVSFLFFSRRLWRRPDFLCVALFCLWNVVSIIVNVGFSAETILSFPVFDLVLIVGAYAVAVSADDPVRLMRLFAKVCAVLLALVNFSVLGIATYSLLADVRVSDPTKWGCFLHERLSGAWNPNILACSCVVLILCAAYAFRITDAKAGKAFYIAAGCIGALNLSLTNSRTSMAAVGAAVGAWIFAALLRREYRTAFFRRITGQSVTRFLFAVVAGLGCAGAAFAVLLLPFFIYRALMQLADVFIDSIRLSVFLKYSLRSVEENVNSAGGRLAIWQQTLRDFLNGDAVRALFGFSVLGTEKIAFINIYGDLENQSHAHNMVLETLRRNGIPGVVLSLAQMVYCGVCGVKILFDRRRSLTEAIPLVLAFAILVIGLMEPVPFSAIYLYFVTLPFFFICGYAVRCREQDRERTKM